MNKKQKIQWPTALVLCVVVLSLAAAYLLGPSLGVPEESHETLVAGVGLIGSAALAFMRGILSHDKDGDGIPDLIDGKTNPPPAGAPVEEDEDDGAES